MYHPSRGGVRGGADQFEWESIKSDKHRENYLGHSLKAPVGRWQKNKDLQWFSRDKKGTGQSNIKEKDAIKRIEAEAMAAALGHGFVKKQTQQLTRQELEEVCKKGQTERDEKDIERIEGMGFGSNRASLMDTLSSTTKETLSAVGTASQEIQKPSKDNKVTSEKEEIFKKHRKEKKKRKKEKHKHKKKKSKKQRESKRRERQTDSHSSSDENENLIKKQQRRRRHDSESSFDHEQKSKKRQRRRQHDSESSFDHEQKSKQQQRRMRHDSESSSDDDNRSRRRKAFDPDLLPRNRTQNISHGQSSSRKRHDSSSEDDIPRKVQKREMRGVGQTSSKMRHDSTSDDKYCKRSSENDRRHDFVDKDSGRAQSNHGKGGEGKYPSGHDSSKYKKSHSKVRKETTKSSRKRHDSTSDN